MRHLATVLALPDSASLAPTPATPDQVRDWIAQLSDDDAASGSAQKRIEALDESWKDTLRAALASARTDAEARRCRLWTVLEKMGRLQWFTDLVRDREGAREETPVEGHRRPGRQSRRSIRDFGPRHANRELSRTKSCARG